jgi:Zn finger protein HypA/HybF involved in hydrogenase expression
MTRDQPELKQPSQEQADGSQPARRAQAQSVEQNAMLYCPNCSQHLESRSCKLRCDRCGYFMDCSDYY